MTKIAIAIDQADRDGHDFDGQAKAVLDLICVDGWTLLPPRDLPGVCPACRTMITPGTEHEPFNGNQMFACQVRQL